MKNPFDYKIEQKIAETIHTKRKPIKYPIYAVAIIAGGLSIYFTTNTMMQSLPIIISVMIAVVITLYIDIAPQMAAQLLSEKRNRIIAFVLYFSLCIPVIFSMSTTIQTIYLFQSKQIEQRRTSALMNKQQDENNNNIRKEVERLKELRNKYDEELKAAQVGSWAERTVRARISEIDTRIESLQSQIKEVFVVRSDFYSFISSITGINADSIEFLLILTPAIFIDIISPILLSVSVLM